MDKDRPAEWLNGERAAHIHGRDFSRIDGRYVEDALPWDFREGILQYLLPEHKLLDIDTGGGLFITQQVGA